MPTVKMTAARREVIHAYLTVRQTPGDGTMTQRVARFLGRKLDKNKSNSYIQRVIREYQQEMSE